MNIGFVSLGCCKNLVDTETMISMVQKAGYTLVADKEEADIVVINTCGFIDDAKEEAINEILETARYKKGRLSQLVVTGCLAQRYAEDIAKELPEVDKIVGVGSFYDIVDILKSDEKMFLGDKNRPCEEHERTLSTPPYSAYIKIAEGCDNNCTYCAIPMIRGKFRSRSMENIKAEAERLLKSGVTEINVVAQDSTRYGIDIYGESRLAELLLMLSEMDFKWIRVLYTYPELLSDKVINVMKEKDNIVNYLDIPFQHISSGVLKRMGRKSTKESTYQLIDKLRKEFGNNITLRTSLMVGFPGETEEDFMELCDFVKYTRFDRMGVFKYSREEGTPAYKLKDQIDEDIKQQRFDCLMEIQNKISEERNLSLIGKNAQVLTEGFEDCFYVGRSRADAPDIDGKVYFVSERDINKGEYVNVRILDAEEYDLVGREEK